MDVEGTLTYQRRAVKLYAVHLEQHRKPNRDRELHPDIYNYVSGRLVLIRGDGEGFLLLICTVFSAPVDVAVDRQPVNYRPRQEVGETYNVYGHQESGACSLLGKVVCMALSSVMFPCCNG